MAPKTEDTRPAAMSQDEFTQMLTTQMKEAVRLTLVTILEAEITALIGALPHERSLTRTDRRNGHYTRDLSTTMGHVEELAVPRTRGGHRTQLFERYARRRPEMDEAIAGMFVKGVSTRGVGEVIRKLYRASDRLSALCLYSVEGVPHVGGGVPGMEESSTFSQIRIPVCRRHIFHSHLRKFYSSR